MLVAVPADVIGIVVFIDGGVVVVGDSVLDDCCSGCEDVGGVSDDDDGGYALN